MPASRLAIAWRWMNSMLPTSRPRVGWSRTSSRRSRANSRAMTTFCWLPPDSVDALASADGVRMSNALIRSSAVSSIAGIVAQQAARVRRAVVAGQDEVVGDAERQDQPEPVPVGRHVADAGFVDARATSRPVMSCRRASPGRPSACAGRRSPRPARPGRCRRRRRCRGSRRPGPRGRCRGRPPGRGRRGRPASRP